MVLCYLFSLIVCIITQIRITGKNIQTLYLKNVWSLIKANCIGVLLLLEISAAFVFIHLFLFHPLSALAAICVSAAMAVWHFRLIFRLRRIRKTLLTIYLYKLILCRAEADSGTQPAPREKERSAARSTHLPPASRL